jgi:hypothetical protein
MNSPFTQQFGLDLISEDFTGTIDGENVAGPGSYLGRMDLTGSVPLPSDTSASQKNYSF